MAEENVIKRIPPQDLNAEKSVIGSMLLDKDAISEVSSMLTKEDFSNAQYGILFEAIVSLYNEGKPVDEIVLSEKLREMGAPDSVANLNYIGEILAGEATPAFARNYAQIVKDKSYLRKLIKLAENMMASAYEGRENADDIMEKSESEMFALMQKKSGLRDFTSINEYLITLDIK